MKKDEQSAFDSMVKIDWDKLFKKVPNDYYNAESTLFPCDDAGGILRIVIGPDGDVHLGVDEHPRAEEVRHLGPPSVRIRTHQGGGRSDRVRKAALLLMLAIIEDGEN